MRKDAEAGRVELLGNEDWLGGLVGRREWRGVRCHLICLGRKGSLIMVGVVR